MERPRVAARTLASIALLSGCAVGPFARLPSEPGAELALSPPASFAAHPDYTTGAVPGGIVGGPLAEDLAREVRAHFPSLSLEPDGRMAELATRAAVAVRLGQGSIGTAKLDSMAKQVGFLGPPPTIVVAPRVSRAWDHLEEYLSVAPSNTRFNRYGVAVLELDGRIAGAIALAAEHLVVDPLKRRVAVGDSTRIRATPEADYSRAELLWTGPAGATVRTAAERGAIAFETPALGPGVHRFEVMGLGPTGLEVLANFPVVCGAEADDPVPIQESVDDSDPKAALLTLVNRDRNRAGFAPLVGDAALDEVAKNHSRDMADAHFFGHQSPTTGVIDDRLRVAGLRLGTFGENVARAPSVAEAHSMLLSSPAHRDNILNSLFSHVGIGVVEEHAPGGRLLAITEVFAAFPVPISDTVAAARATFDELNRTRARENETALVRTPPLDHAANDIATLMSQNTELDPARQISALLRRTLKTRQRKTLVLTSFAVDPKDVARDVRLHVPRLRYVGVAIVQLSGDGTPRTNVTVLVLME